MGNIIQKNNLFCDNLCDNVLLTYESRTSCQEANHWRKNEYKNFYDKIYFDGFNYYNDEWIRKNIRLIARKLMMIFNKNNVALKVEWDEKNQKNFSFSFL